MRFSNLKKLLFSLLIACLLGTSTGILTASAQQPPLQVMVWEWSPDVDEALEKGLWEFGEAYGIDVELVRLPFEAYWEKLYTSLAAGAPPDLFWISGEMLEKLAEGEMIIPLDDFVAEAPEVIKGLPPEALERFTFEGRLYGIPVGSSGDFAEVAYAISVYEALGPLRDLVEFGPFWLFRPPYMKMDPPPDSDKPLPVPANDGSCWLHTAANMLAGAGYGNGTTVQDRADDIWNDMDAHYRNPDGSFNGGWIDAALQWWLGSANNTWSANPYTLPTVYGNKTKVPWANANGARDIGNELRTCNMVGLSISWPTGHGGTGGHAITAWGDDITSPTALTTNPGGVRVTDSDTDTGGDVQAYTYDAYTNPNPGGSNEGNGWYFNYGTNHPFIKHIATLSPGSGANSVRVTGSYKIHQTSEQAASDLHYRVGTDVDILTYRTWLDWPAPPPTITETEPRRELTVDWDLSAEKVPYCRWVTISTEFVEPSWNSISYHDVHFTYPEGMAVEFPNLTWMMDTPVIEEAEAIPNVTGGYVIGSFDVYDPKTPDEPAVQYRLVHQYLYNQSPERHLFLVAGTPEFYVTNLRFGHSYGYPTAEELWKFENWMTDLGDKVYTLSDERVEIEIDWEGRLPYPEGDRGTG